MTIEEICKNLGVEGKIIACDVIKSGHINDTFKITTRSENGECEYIVQQINTYVFKKPVKMMDNISRVTQHISEKVSENKDRMVLSFLKNEKGESCFFDNVGKCWRGYRFINESVTFDTCDDPEILRQAGIAFGRFQMMLGDFDASTLFETIPDFHDTEKRMQDLFDAEEADPLGRVAGIGEELDFFKENYENAVKITRLLKMGKIPLRVTHNDTKCNNVLFDKKTKQALAVIDLDTVMPGSALYDFGDAIRFSCNSAEEDEPDTTKVWCDADKFRAFTKGFLSVAGEILTETEKENLVSSAVSISLEIAGRFLEDYIMGDKYFKTDYPGHNLVRVRNQIALIKDILKKRDELEEIVKEII